MLQARSDLDLQILEPGNRITAVQLFEELNMSSINQRHLLVDVRSESEFKMCRIDGALNYPIEEFRGGKVDEVLRMIDEVSKVIFICRRGNDSQIAAKKIIDQIAEDHRHKVKDVVGGLHSWSTIDQDFPVY